MTTYKIGDMVRLVKVSPDLYADDPISKETAAFFEQCLENVFRVEGFENGQLELWTTADGKHRATSDSSSHTIWIEPEYIELVTE